MKIVVIIFLILFGGSVKAQSTSSKTLFKDFIALCNNYKYLPLQLSIGFKKSTNYLMDEADTASINGEFSLQNNVAYIKFGEAEQVIEDSVVLICLKDIKHMILTEAKIDIAEHINNMISLPVKDSSISVLNSVYDITLKKIDKTTSIFEIVNKQSLSETTLPMEFISLEYNSKANEPVKIITIKRALKLITEGTVYPKEIVMVSIKDKGDFFVKEEITTYDFTNIKHEKNVQIPVRLKDRVIKDNTSNYTAVKGFEDYRVTVN
jgi:hypothetical protein